MHVAQVVQYMELFKAPSWENAMSSLDDSVMYFTDFYDKFLADDDFDKDDEFDEDDDFDSNDDGDGYDDEDDGHDDDDAEDDGDDVDDDDYGFDDDHYFYSDDSIDSTTANSETFPEGSYCRQVLDDAAHYFSFLFVEPLPDVHHDSNSNAPTFFSSTNLTSSSSSSSTKSVSSPADGFDKDVRYGHGTQVAGIAAGSVQATSPYLTYSCRADEVPACAGECMTESDAEERIDNKSFDIDTYCPAYDCDGYGAGSEYCLGDDPLETLVENSGVAQGARLAIFDVGFKDDILPDMAGNLLWHSSFGTGAKIHTNSWGASTYCEPTEADYLYDIFMFQVS